MVDRSAGIVGMMFGSGTRQLGSSLDIKNGRVVRRCSDLVGEHRYVR